MPLYEYKCDACGAVFEVIQKFSDSPVTVHEACGGAVQRVITAPAFQFKGTGWYVTDYARKAGANGPGKGDSAEAKSVSKDSKNESKDSKSESKDSKSDAKKSDSAPARTESSTPAPAKSEKSN